MKYQLFNFAGPDGEPRIAGHVGGKHVHFGTIDLLDQGDKSQACLARFVAEEAVGASSVNPDTITFLSPLCRLGMIFYAGAGYRNMWWQWRKPLTCVGGSPEGQTNSTLVPYQDRAGHPCGASTNRFMPRA